MTYLFFVQGEGRGHLTQALTLKAKLEARGHEILAVIAGPDPDYGLPAFFEEQLKDKLIRIYSPRFIVDGQNQGINLRASIINSLKQLFHYRRSIKQIKKIISEKKPDAIINFYEPLAGIYCRYYGDKRPLFCISHQYFTEHPSFKFPSGKIGDSFGLKLYNRLTAPRHGLRIALSFTEEADFSGLNMVVCPPLIRHDLLRKAPTSGDFILVYLLNAGYSQEIIAWNSRNPQIKIEAFWNKPDSETIVLNDNLAFHHLHGEKFIDRLINCRAYVSTAGFDSIAEAAYLQKNILMIPTKNHFEQKCNAHDAGRAGLALTADGFDLSLLAGEEKTHSNSALRAFKEWVDGNSDKILKILENERQQ